MDTSRREPAGEQRRGRRYCYAHAVGGWSERGSLHLVLWPLLCALESTFLASQGSGGVGGRCRSRGLESPKEWVPLPPPKM